jgi:PAS domain-containing protein
MLPRLGASGGDDMTASHCRARTYSVYARYRRGRLKLMVALPTLEAARMNAARLKNARFHGHDTVMVVDDLTGRIVEDGELADTPIDTAELQGSVVELPSLRAPPSAERLRPELGNVDVVGRTRMLDTATPTATLLGAIAEGSAIAMLLTEGRAHRIVYGNPAFAKLLALLEPATAGARLKDLLPTDRTAFGVLTAVCDEVFRTGQLASTSNDRAADVPARVAATFCVSATTGAAGEIVGLLVVARESTDDMAGQRIEAVREEARLSKDLLIAELARERDRAERASAEATRLAALLASRDRSVLNVDTGRDRIEMKRTARHPLGASQEDQSVSARSRDRSHDKASR